MIILVIFQQLTLCALSHTHKVSSSKSTNKNRIVFNKVFLLLCCLVRQSSSNLPSVVATRSNSFKCVSVRTDRCFDFTCFWVENTHSQTYVDPNVDSILPVWCWGIFSLVHFSRTQWSLPLKQLSADPPHKDRSSPTQPQPHLWRAGLSNSLSFNGWTRNVICGLFSCRSQIRVTKLSCRFVTSVTYLSLFFFRVALVTCSLALA